MIEDWRPLEFVAYTSLWKPNEGPRPNKEWLRDKVMNDVNNDVTRRAQTPTGERTQHWKGQSPRNGANGDVTNSNKDLTDPSLYKLTALEFKRLTQQVREVNAATDARFKGVNFKPTKVAPPCGDKQSAVYRSHLASSQKAFQEKSRAPYTLRKPWNPYESVVAETPEPRPPSSSSSTAGGPGLTLRPSSALAGTRPGSSRLERIHARTVGRYMSGSRPNTAGARQRPRSSPPDQLSLRAQAINDTAGHNYDTLDPEVVYELNEGQQPESVYGERRAPTSREPEEGMEGDEEGEKIVDSDDSDEDYPEPELDNVKLKRAPELILRPEEVDAMDIPIIPKGDRRKYDFDATKVLIPEYEFAPGLSGPMQSMDLRDLAAHDKHWKEYTKKRAEDDMEDAMIERLIEFERLQMKTEEWEKERRERARLARQRAQARGRLGARITSAKTWREKKCVPDCTQVACVGDCPSKKEALERSITCLICLERDCTGNCVESSYENRKRTERAPEPEETKSVATTTTAKSNKPKSRPKSCNSCLKHHNAKYLNANNIILGRPRSSHATYSRGQQSHKQKDIRPTSEAAIDSVIEQEFERLGMDATVPVPPEAEVYEEEERPETACSNASPAFGRLKGRSGSVPGKSYFSQRRLSLTDQTGRERVQKTKKRIKSGKKRRPKTAA